MAEIMEKPVLLDNIQKGYAQFEALLAPLSEAQMITSSRQGSWSIKDTIAHLTVWQNYLLEQLQGVVVGKEPSKFMPELPTEDVVNEYFYHKNKPRPLAEVLVAFRSSYQRVLTIAQSMSEEILNTPFSWRSDGKLVWILIAHNTYEHYSEHGANIERLLRYNTL